MTSEIAQKGQMLALKFLGIDPHSADAETWFESGRLGEFYAWLVKEGKIKMVE
jgi:hypothetical protein